MHNYNPIPNAVLIGIMCSYCDVREWTLWV